MSFFLNEKNHLCQEGETQDEDGNWISQAWCLADNAESTEWIQMPVSGKEQLELMETLPAKIISSMIKANKVN